MAITRRKYCTRCHRPLVHIDEHRTRTCHRCRTTTNPVPWKKPKGSTS